MYRDYCRLIVTLFPSTFASIMDQFMNFSPKDFELQYVCLLTIATNLELSHGIDSNYGICRR